MNSDLKGLNIVHLNTPIVSIDQSYHKLFQPLCLSNWGFAEHHSASW